VTLRASLPAQWTISVSKPARRVELPAKRYFPKDPVTGSVALGRLAVDRLHVIEGLCEGG
jgi:hypothetical protein